MSDGQRTGLRIAWKLIPLFLVLAMVTAATSACGVRREGELTVGYMSIAECLPFFVAQEKGYFVDEGLSIITIQFPGGAPALEALRTKSVDIAFSNLVSAVFGRSAEIDFRMVWGSNVEDADHVLHGLVAIRTTDGPSIAEVIQRPIAVNTRRNIDELMLQEWLGTKGVIDTDLQLVEIPFPRMASVLKSGSVAAIAVVEPFLSATLDSLPSLNLGFYYTEAMQEVYITSYFAMGSRTSELNADVHRFCSAMGKAIEFITANDIEARKILAQYTRLPVEIALKVQLPLFKATIPSSQGLESISHAMLDRKWIEKPVSLSDFIWD